MYFRYQNFDIADLEPGTLRSDVVSYFVFKKVRFYKTSGIFAKFPMILLSGGPIPCGEAAAGGGSSEGGDLCLLPPVHRGREAAGEAGLGLLSALILCLQEVLVRKNRDKDLYNHAIRLR